jgi:hypothetical protein
MRTNPQEGYSAQDRRDYLGQSEQNGFSSTVQATSAGLGGFRATVVCDGINFESKFFPVENRGAIWIDKAYAEMKQWLGEFGL